MTLQMYFNNVRPNSKAGPICGSLFIVLQVATCVHGAEGKR
jgi:hypothetical protein